MALPDIGKLFKLATEIDKIFGLHKQVEESLKLINDRLRAQEDRPLRLEAEQKQLVSEVRAAAAAASTTMTSAVIGDAVIPADVIIDSSAPLVMAGLVPAIHVFPRFHRQRRGWWGQAPP